jgi:hypothetical protein
MTRPQGAVQVQYFQWLQRIRALTLHARETYTAEAGRLFSGDSMRNRSWLRAALPPAFVVAAVAIIAAHPSVRAQGGSQERALFVSALNGDGAPVPGLAADDFVVRENGMRREILRVTPATEPIDLTLLIDNSRAASDKITYYRMAIPEFLNALPQNTTITLVGLADRPTMLVKATTDRKRVISRAESLFATPNSGATLLDGVLELSEGLVKRDAPRAVMVAIVTDGTEFTNRYSKDVVAALKQARVPLYLVTIGQFLNDTQHADRERAFFIAAAPKASGGAHLSMLVANGLSPALAKLATELKSQYKVVYARPDSLIPPDTIEITSPREGLTVRGAPERLRKGA